MDQATLRAINTTIAKYFKTVEEAVLRKRVVLAMLMSKGNIHMGASGLKMNWKIRFRRTSSQPLLGGQTLTFVPRDQWRTAELGWRGFASTNSIEEFELEMNKGKEAIVNVWSNAAKLLASDIEQNFADQLYTDGEASGRESDLHGFESIFGTNGVSTKRPIGINDDSYAGVATDLASEGGSWSTTGTNTSYTDWPDGRGDYHYDFFTPLVVNYSSTISTSAGAGNIGWSASTKTWLNTCIEALRFGILGCSKNDGPDAKMDLIILEQAMMRDLKNKLQAEEQITVTKNTGPGSPYALGFTDTINVDGVDCMWEYGVPANVGYGLPLGLIELHSLKPKLFNPGGPDFRPEDQSWRIWTKFMGNLKFGNEKGGVRNFLKFAALG